MWPRYSERNFKPGIAGNSASAKATLLRKLGSKFPRGSTRELFPREQTRMPFPPRHPSAFRASRQIDCIKSCRLKERSKIGESLKSNSLKRFAKTLEEFTSDVEEAYLKAGKGTREMPVRRVASLAGNCRQIWTWLASARKSALDLLPPLFPYENRRPYRNALDNLFSDKNFLSSLSVSFRIPKN